MDKKDHKRCFISGCHGKNDKENTHVGVFGVPKASLAMWRDIVPKDGLTASSKICSKHFEEADIEKGRTIQDIFYPYSRWKLKLGAVPKLFLGPTSSWPSSSSKTIAAPKKSNNSKTPAKDSPVALPRLLPKGPTDVPSSHICATNTSLPACGPVTHYIIVQDSSPTPQNSRTPAVQNGLSVTTPTDILPSSAIPLAQNDSIAMAPSYCDHDYALGTARPIVPVEKNSTVISVSHTQQSQDASSSAAHDFDHSYGVRPPSLTPTIEEACLDLNFAGYHDFISDVIFPTDEWSWSFNLKKKHLMCSSHCMSDDGVMTVKTLRFLSKTRVQLFINGKPIIEPDLKLEFQRKADLSYLIKDFHFRNTCQGFVDESLADLKVTDKCAGIKEGNAWRSKECQGLTRSGVVCPKCRILRKNLKRMNGRQTKQPKDVKERYQKKIHATRRALRRTESKMEKLSITISELRKERQKLIRDGFDAKIRILNPKEQLVVKTMMAKAKVRPGRDDRLTAMRYDPEFIADSLLIKQKSTAVYKHLRSKGILPLPSEATLLRAAKKLSLGGSNSGQTGEIPPANPPHENALDESISLDSEQSTPGQQSDEGMENDRSESPDLAVAMSPSIVLVEPEDITDPITDDMIVEIYSVE